MIPLFSALRIFVLFSIPPFPFSPSNLLQVFFFSIVKACLPIHRYLNTDVTKLVLSFLFLYLDHLLALLTSQSVLHKPYPNSTFVINVAITVKTFLPVSLFRLHLTHFTQQVIHCDSTVPAGQQTFMCWFFGWEHSSFTPLPPPPTRLPFWRPALLVQDNKQIL